MTPIVLVSTTALTHCKYVYDIVTMPAAMREFELRTDPAMSFSQNRICLTSRIWVTKSIKLDISACCKSNVDLLRHHASLLKRLWWGIRSYWYRNELELEIDDKGLHNNADVTKRQASKKGQWWFYVFLSNQTPRVDTTRNESSQAAVEKGIL